MRVDAPWGHLMVTEIHPPRLWRNTRSFPRRGKTVAVFFWHLPKATQNGRRTIASSMDGMNKSNIVSTYTRCHASIWIWITYHHHCDGQRHGRSTLCAYENRVVVVVHECGKRRVRRYHRRSLAFRRVPMYASTHSHRNAQNRRNTFPSMLSFPRAGNLEELVGYGEGKAALHTSVIACMHTLDTIASC